jgi:hypothetical protein
MDDSVIFDYIIIYRDGKRMRVYIRRLIMLQSSQYQVAKLLIIIKWSYIKQITTTLKRGLTSQLHI